MSTDREASAVPRGPLRGGGALVQADELRPGALARTHVGRVQVLRRRRRPDRLAPQAHPRLGERAPALAVIAGLAGGDDVFPDVLATAVARDHVVEREVVAPAAAVLAGVLVPGKG